jgi:hypothetical protein
LNRKGQEERQGILDFGLTIHWLDHESAIGNPKS